MGLGSLRRKKCCYNLNAVVTDGNICLNDFLSLGLIDHRGALFEFKPSPGASLVVVFIRGHWCPYCRRYLCKLQQHLQCFREIGGRVVVISPEPAQTSAGMVSQLRITIPILADTRGRAIDLFGVRNRFRASVTPRMPHPAVIIFRDDGQVAFRSVDRNYKSRTSMRTLLHQLRALARTEAC